MRPKMRVPGLGLGFFIAQDLAGAHRRHGVVHQSRAFPDHGAIVQIVVAARSVRGAAGATGDVILGTVAQSHFWHTGCIVLPDLRATFGCLGSAAVQRLDFAICHREKWVVNAITELNDHAERPLLMVEDDKPFLERLVARDGDARLLSDVMR